MEVKVHLVDGPHPGAEVEHPGLHVKCLCHMDDGEYEFSSITYPGPAHVATYTWHQYEDRAVQEPLPWS